MTCLTLIFLSGGSSATAQFVIVRAAGDQTNATITSSAVVFQDAQSPDGSTDLKAVSWESVTTTIVADAGSQLSPAGFGNLVVYVDRPFPSGEPILASSIVIVDLTTGIRLSVSSGPTFKESPTLWGTCVLWTEGIPGSRDVMSFDLDSDDNGSVDFLEHSPPSAGQPGVFAGGPGDQMAPTIGERGAAWVDSSAGASAVMFRESGASSSTALCANAGFKSPAPRIGGHLVVWKQTSIDGITSDVAVHDLDNGSVTLLGSVQGCADDQPVTDGTRVFWVSTSGGGPGQVWMRSAEGSIGPVAPSTSHQASPCVGGDYLTWVDGRFDNADICFASIADVRVTEPDVATSLAAAFSQTGSTTLVTSYKASTFVLGHLTRADGASIPSQTVDLEYSYDNRTFYKHAATPAEVSPGRFQVSVASTQRTYYRFRFPGSEGYSSSVSGPLLVRPRAWLTTPLMATSVLRTSYCSLYGYLKPRHSGDAVRIYAYRYEHGVWVRRVTVYARAYNYWSYSRYVGKIRLPYAGRWRIRAYHADSGHYPTYSAYRYVTVR